MNYDDDPIGNHESRLRQMEQVYNAYQQQQAVQQVRQLIAQSFNKRMAEDPNFVKNQEKIYNAESAKLRKLYPNATQQQIDAEIETMTIRQGLHFLQSNIDPAVGFETLSETNYRSSEEFERKQRGSGQYEKSRAVDQWQRDQLDIPQADSIFMQAREEKFGIVPDDAYLQERYGQKEEPETEEQQWMNSGKPSQRVQRQAYAEKDWAEEHASRLMGSSD